MWWCGSGVTAWECIDKPPGNMIASRSLRLFAFLILASVVQSKVQESVPVKNEHFNNLESKKFELYDGVYVKVPEKNNTEKIISFEMDTYNRLEEGRGKKKKLMERILPLFLMPFLLQSAIIPLVLGALKFMLFKSLMVGKFALLLILLNAFRNHNSFKGRDAEMANVHYGYHGNGMAEYGVFGK